MDMFDGIRVQPSAANYFFRRGCAGAMRGVLGVLSGGYAASGVVNWRKRALAAARPTRRKFAGHCCGILLVGIGGGLALDTAKAVAARLDRPFVAIPTVAATCVAWMPLSVWYDDDDRPLGYKICPLAK